MMMLKVDILNKNSIVLFLYKIKIQLFLKRDKNFLASQPAQKLPSESIIRKNESFFGLYAFFLTGKTVHVKKISFVSIRLRIMNRIQNPAKITFFFFNMYLLHTFKDQKQLFWVKIS